MNNRKNTKRDDRNLDLQFKQQLESWKIATGKEYWTELLEFTPYFFADRRQYAKLRPDTVTKTLKRRPVKNDGLYNVFTLFGVIYTLGGVNAQDIETFLHDCEIGIPTDTTWREIWERIEIGRQAFGTRMISRKTIPKENQSQINDNPHSEKISDQDTIHAQQPAHKGQFDSSTQRDSLFPHRFYNAIWRIIGLLVMLISSIEIG